MNAGRNGSYNAPSSQMSLALPPAADAENNCANYDQGQEV